MAVTEPERPCPLAQVLASKIYVKADRPQAAQAPVTDPGDLAGCGPRSPGSSPCRRRPEAVPAAPTTRKGDRPARGAGAYPVREPGFCHARTPKRPSKAASEKTKEIFGLDVHFRGLSHRPFLRLDRTVILTATTTIDLMINDEMVTAQPCHYPWSR